MKHWNPDGGPSARSRVISLLSFGAVGLVLLYAGLLAALWWFQERVVFQPPAGIVAAPVAAARVAYRAADGVELFAYLVGDCAPDSTVLIAFHGNADIARWLVPWATVIAREASVCVMLPEYRGYDGLAGAPTYRGSAADSRAAFAYVRDTLHVPPSKMVFFGHSLGTAIAAELAAAETPRSLVLQSPFSTARDMAARMFLPGLTAFWRMVSRVHFDTIERVRGLRAPVWVSHGDRDIIIPVRMGREVFAAAAQPGELLIVPGAGHNDVADVGGRDYWSWLTRAIHAAPTAPTTPGESASPGVRAGTRSVP